MKVTELLDRIADLEVDTDLPVVMATRLDHGVEPKHVQVQRMCNEGRVLTLCGSALCKTAFMALVIW